MTRSSNIQSMLGTELQKSLSSNEMSKRLRVVWQELRDLDQENVELEPLHKLAAQLAACGALQHKNRGVASLACCCAADILRLCAPDAPFAKTQLRAVFLAFIREMKNVNSPDVAIAEQTSYLIESLATVESIVLIGDIDDKNENLVHQVFKNLLGSASEDMSPQLLSHFTSILSQLIDEIDQIPNDVVSTLLTKIRNTSKTHTTFSLESPATKIAKAVVSRSGERLQRNICQYFTDILLEIKQLQDANDDEISESDLRSAHDLVYDLFCIAPVTLQNVIPQLETELGAENTACRSLATEILGQMLAHPNGAIVIEKHVSTYKLWTSRRNDKVAMIRIKWTEALGNILCHAAGSVRIPEVEKLCVDGLVTRLVDPDERVRSAACKVLEGLEYTVAKQRLTSTVLRHFCDRCRDKRQQTQQAAFSYIGKLFDSSYADILSEDVVAITKFGPLVNHVLHCVYINDASISALLEETLYTYILKVDDTDDEKRCRRYLEVLKLCDDKSRRALFAIVGQNQKTYRQLLQKFVQGCEKLNGSAIDSSTEKLGALLHNLMSSMTSKLANPEEAQAQLKKIMEHNDHRLYKLLRLSMDPASDQRTVLKTNKEILKRAEQISKQAVQVLRGLLLHSTYLVCNHSIITPLNRYANDKASSLSTSAQRFLREIGATHATLLKTHTDALLREISQDPGGVSLETIRALAHYCKSSPNVQTIDTATEDALKIVMLESDHKRAKQASTILCTHEGNQTLVYGIISDILKHLTYGVEHLSSKLASIAQVTLLRPVWVEPLAADISTFCAKELLMKNRALREEDDHIEWQDEDERDEEDIAKSLAVIILGNRLRAYHDADTATEIAEPVFKALRAIVNNMGELSAEDTTPLRYRARLRLTAVKVFLKLARFKVYESLINSQDFVQIALFAQDLEFNVRRRFLDTLHKSLVARQLTPRWHTIVFLTALDPDVNLKEDVRKRAMHLAAIHRPEDYLMESMLPRFIHLLAHHPDFSASDRNEDDLLIFALYFDFYFDCVVTSDSLPLVYHYAQRIKQVEDSTVDQPSSSNNIYIISDLAQIVIAMKAESHGWPLLAYPKKLKLPTDLYQALPTNSEVNSRQSQSYLTDSEREILRGNLLKRQRPQRPVKVHNGPTHAVKKRISSSPRTKAAAKKQKKNKSNGEGEAKERRTSSRIKSNSVVYKDSKSDSEDESGVDTSEGEEDAQSNSEGDV